MKKRLMEKWCEILEKDYEKQISKIKLKIEELKHELKHYEKWSYFYKCPKKNSSN